MLAQLWWQVVAPRFVLISLMVKTLVVSQSGPDSALVWVVLDFLTPSVLDQAWARVQQASLELTMEAEHST